MFKNVRWQDVNHLNQTQLKVAERLWLLDSRSLTQRLIEASHGEFRVKCLRQSWRVPENNEAMLLGLKPRQKAWIREVYLYCYDEPWVYARSVIPPKSLQGELGFLRKLKNAALGALLFKDPHLQRGSFQVDLIEDSGHIIYGRRSLFKLYGQPLLVAEYFLPACKLSEIEVR